MEKEILEMFIYYILSIQEEGTQDYSLNGCVKEMEIALKTIKNKGIKEWNESLEKFPKNHPLLKIQTDLMRLTQEQYIEKLEKSLKLMKRYSLSGTTNYDSLYLIDSNENIEDLADKIILNSKTTEEILKISKEINENNRYNILVIDELCARYCFGIETDVNYGEAIKGWEMISEYSNDAKYSLALCYKKGRGVEKSYKKAYELLVELMNKDIRAKYEVARMDFFGQGIEQDYKEAYDIFHNLKGKAPYDMEKWIDSYIGEMYFYGLGIEKDKEKGLKLMENAWNDGISLNYNKIKSILCDYYNVNN